MNGHCLCSAVTFTSPEAKEIGACHCGVCRRWGGGPLLAVHCGPAVEFRGVDQMPYTRRRIGLSAPSAGRVALISVSAEYARVYIVADPTGAIANLVPPARERHLKRVRQ